MQLLLAALLLLSSAGGRGYLEEVKPYIKELGGEQGGEILEVLEQAEELSQVLSAVTRFTQDNSPNEGGRVSSEFNEAPDANLILAPIKNLADSEIYSSLSAYIAV